MTTSVQRENPMLPINFSIQGTFEKEHLNGVPQTIPTHIKPPRADGHQNHGQNSDILPSPSDEVGGVSIAIPASKQED